MLEVPFKLKSNCKNYTPNQAISFQIPFAKAHVFQLSNLSVSDSNHDELPAILSSCLFWPDGSVKWAQCDFISPLADIENTQTYKIIAKPQDNNTAATPTITVKQSKDEIFIDTLCSQYTLDTNNLTINQIPLLAHLLDNNNQVHQLIVDSISIPAVNEKHFRLTITINGHFIFNDKKSLEFDSQFTFTINSPVIEQQFTLRNPLPMVHHQGKWDLGNENSFFFNCFEFQLAQKNANTSLIIDSETDAKPLTITTDFTLYQASSGGKNWQSDNHFDHTRKNNIPFNGYQLQQTDEQLIAGERSQPIIQTIEKQQCAEFAIAQFWQNFPKALSSKNKQLTLALFPAATASHELQPGEQKTHTLFLCLNDTPYLQRHLNQQPLIELDAGYISQTKSIPLFTEQKSTDEIDEIINIGIEGKNNFFEKREQIDEFGWRNFGDLYADHETLEYQGEQELISHYNNQYDPLYGFLKQYLLSGEQRWLELANDLARHVKDIDIYHCDSDKVEYNNGLFWHTDHYLPAETASHRTYSQYQQADAYQDHAGGGGPGGQHCYTTGLMLHYFLTGDETSKTTVINLAEWITHLYEGAGTVLDTLLKIKSRHYAGVKNIVSGQYPLDRGTANYIIALIDAYEVSGQQSYLDRASLVIKNTATPTENLSLRNLDKVEECWFYTVFLQAIARYLSTKEQVAQFDESFDYSRAVLLHFANWMAEHEKPYLSQPEILEYPNHTWAAQDIRKANVLFAASYYALEQHHRENYLKKANEIYDYVGAELSTIETKYFTRILSILMQNHGIKHYFADKVFSAQNSAQPAIPDIEDATSEKRKILHVITRSLFTFSLKNEVNWLRKRAKKVDNLLVKIGIN